jgi:hypothetical protein
MFKKFIPPVMALSVTATALLGTGTAFAATNLTASFSDTMRYNAANIAYYAISDKQQGTYPLGTKTADHDGRQYTKQLDCHSFYAYNIAFAIESTFSAVKPNFSTTISPGAEAPK